MHYTSISGPVACSAYCRYWKHLGQPFIKVKSRGPIRSLGCQYTSSFSFAVRSRPAVPRQGTSPKQPGRTSSSHAAKWDFPRFDPRLTVSVVILDGWWSGTDYVCLPFPEQRQFYDSYSPRIFILLMIVLSVSRQRKRDWQTYFRQAFRIVEVVFLYM